MMSSKKSAIVMSDQWFRDTKMVTDGSRRLCAAILKSGRTHGPCDIRKAIGYAHNVEIKG
jgi:hypothetical protein